MSSVAVEDLPPEILLKIFEYLPAEDLLKVQDVCIKWKEFAQTSAVWEKFVYSPDGESDEEILKFLQKCPMLKHIYSDRMPEKDTFVPAVINNCFDIHSFCVEFMPTLTVAEIDGLFEAFPNLVSLLIRIESPDAKQMVERLSKCTKLKKLILSGQYCVDGIFKPIIDGCVSLEYLSFDGGFPNVSERDLLYVLYRLNERLIYLRFGYSPTTQQIVNLLGTFTKLEDLALHDATHGQVVDFRPLANVKTLKCLEFEVFASESDELCRMLDVLFDQPFPLLEKLNICFFHCQYDKTIFKKIFQCYPNLKYLRLYGQHPDDLKDGFEHICKLAKLEGLAFSSSDTITNDDIAHISGCHKLKNLDLSSNKLLTDETLVHLAKCKNLESLDLSYTSISGQNLYLIADNLKRLKSLDVKQCEKLEESSVYALVQKMPSLKIVKDGVVCFG